MPYRIRTIACTNINSYTPLFCCHAGASAVCLTANPVRSTSPTPARRPSCQPQPKALAWAASRPRALPRRFSGTCITCSSSPDPSKCIKCLDSFYPKLTCTSAEYSNCYKPDFDNPCATCQKVATSSYDQCVSCFTKPSSKVDCKTCSVLSGPTAQCACFKCSAKNPSGGSNSGGCGLCYAHSKNTALLNQCVHCLTDDRRGDHTTLEQRGVCSLCALERLEPHQRAVCAVLQLPRRQDRGVRLQHIHVRHSRNQPARVRFLPQLPRQPNQRPRLPRLSRSRIVSRACRTGCPAQALLGLRGRLEACGSSRCWVRAVGIVWVMLCEPDSG
jgi:hypothetical protein